VEQALNSRIPEGVAHQPSEAATAGGLAAAPIDAAAATTIRLAYAGQLLPDAQVEVFRTTDRIFPIRTIRRGTRIHPLPHAQRPLRNLDIAANGERYDLFDYVSRNRVAGLLVLKRGAIVLEHYEFGNDASSRWMSMSIAKSISTTLIGAAVQDGFIASLGAPLVDHLPELAGSVYADVPIRHLLQMTSGVDWDDTHTNPDSDRRRMLELQIGQQPGAIIHYVAGRPRVASPGTAWNYSTGETHMVGALLRAATGRWLADYLSEKIWAAFGMEADASWWLESARGLEVAGSGISATLRDYGRFGLFMMNDGVVTGRRVLPEGWVREATAPRRVGGAQLDYGYMWWPVAAANGSFSEHAYRSRGPRRCSR
jgi:CubicO group peptidase (beta-lactamase class C family)